MKAARTTAAAGGRRAPPVYIRGTDRALPPARGRTKPRRAGHPVRYDPPKRQRTRSKSRAGPPPAGRRSTRPVTTGRAGRGRRQKRGLIKAEHPADWCAASVDRGAAVRPPARTARITVPQPTPRSAATRPRQWSPARPGRAHSARARSDSTARGRIAASVTDHVRCERRGSWQRQIRLKHTRITVRPLDGRSRTERGLRSCSVATTPQPG